jgi:hypothetical protein
MTEPQGLKHKKGTEQVYHVNFLFDEAKYNTGEKRSFTIEHHRMVTYHGISIQYKKLNERYNHF